MPRRTHKRAAAGLRESAGVFAALGDETRLALVSKLGRGETLSITRLTEGQQITRQAITKHLRVLRHAGLVRSVKRGRETCFELRAERLDAARRTLTEIARMWDDALARLKAAVEHTDSRDPDRSGRP